MSSPAAVRMRTLRADRTTIHLKKEVYSALLARFPAVGIQNIHDHASAAISSLLGVRFRDFLFDVLDFCLKLRSLLL